MKFPEQIKDYKKIFIFLSLITGIALPVLSFDFGITEDEHWHNNHGNYVLDYFLGESDLASRNPIDSTGNLNFVFDAEMNDLTGSVNLYGGLFDLICVVAERYLSPFGIFETRHLINSLFGVLLIVFTGLSAQVIAGWRAGVIALLFSALSPRIIGHSMNNPVDIPFAAMYMFNIYFIFRLLSELPRPSSKTWIPLLIGIPLAIDIRISGLLLIFYIILFVSAKYFSRIFSEVITMGRIKEFLRAITLSSFLCAAAYLLASVLWPLAHQNPVTIPFLALEKFSYLNVFDSLDIFEGKWIHRWEIPWYFIPKWILMSTPLFISAGLLLSLLFLFPRLLQISGKKVLLVLFLTLFPLLFIILRESNVYNDGRHVMFAVPPLFVLCALAFENFFMLRTKKYLRISVLIFLPIFLLEPLWWMIKNHPNQVVYFSPLIGGVDGAWKKYETDYWGNSVRQAVEWIQQTIKPENGGSIRIRNWYGDQMKAKYYIQKQEGYKHVRAADNSTDWDYSIFQPVQCKYYPEVLFNWPPPGTIYEIKADNTPLCAIVKNNYKAPVNTMVLDSAGLKSNTAHDEHINLGLQYFNEGKFNESIEESKLALKFKPSSALAYNNMCAAYNSLRKWEEAKNAGEKALALQPDFQLARNNLNFAVQQLNKK